MIKNTFLLLDRVGEDTEKSIWSQGINDWDSFISKEKVKGISAKSKLYYNKMLRLAKDMLLAENSSYFTSVLPPSEHWRLYKDFRDDAVFIDLEFSSIKGYPTIISLYDGYDVKTFVRGMNMDKELIKHELDKAKLIVSFNGSVFDMHFLKRYFNIDTDIPHFDLRFALARLGYSGGLKDIEKEFGIRRLNHFVDDLKSGDPFLLWRTFLATADDHYLDLLVEYNQEDVINLKVISDKVIERLEWTCKN